MHTLWKHFGSQFLKPPGEKNGASGTKRELTRPVRSYKNQKSHWHVSASPFQEKKKSFVSVYASLTSLPSLAWIVFVWWVNCCLMEFLLWASRPSSFPSTLRCNKTKWRSIVRVSLRRGKLPFMAVKTRQQHLVNKHVTVCHGIHRLSAASLPFLCGETTIPFKWLIK